MIDSLYPSTEQLLSAQRNRRNRIFILMISVVLIIFTVVTVVSYIAPQLPSAALFALGIVIFALISTPVMVWNNPRVGFYILIGAVMLLEMDPRISGAERLPTKFLPFFLNLNNVGDMFGTRALNPVKFSLAELVIVSTFLTWIVRGVADRTLRFQTGLFFNNIALYMSMVAFGFFHGITSGGDVTMALWEIRSQFMFFAVYLLTANFITDKKQIYLLLWFTLIGTFIRSLFGIYIFISIGGAVTDQGILQHEDSLFFNMVFLIFIATAMIGSNPKLFYASLLALPTCMFSNLENQRRAGIASFVIAFVPMLPLLYIMLQRRRTQIVAFSIGFVIFSAAYLPVAWNSEGAWALPARSIRSQFSPDMRDAGSDNYRMTEDLDLKYTRDTSPFIGIGYGKPFIQIYQLPHVASYFQNYLPHNSILWVWMRLGHFGFFAFIMLFACILIKGVQTLKEVKDSLLQLAGILAILLSLMLFVFAKYDLALVNSRTMALLGLYLGVLGVLKTLEKPDVVNVIEAPEDTETFEKQSNPLQDAFTFYE